MGALDVLIGPMEYVNGSRELPNAFSTSFSDMFVAHTTSFDRIGMVLNVLLYGMVIMQCYVYWTARMRCAITFFISLRS